MILSASYHQFSHNIFFFSLLQLKGFYWSVKRECLAFPFTILIKIMQSKKKQQPHKSVWHCIQAKDIKSNLKEHVHSVNQILFFSLKLNEAAVLSSQCLILHFWSINTAKHTGLQADSISTCSHHISVHLSVQNADYNPRLFKSFNLTVKALEKKDQGYLIIYKHSLQLVYCFLEYIVQIF